MAGLFQYHFMQNAFMAGTVVAIMAGMAGYFMVLRGQSFVGHTLANVGFAGVTAAPLLGMAPVLGLFAAGVLAAFGIFWLAPGIRSSRRNDVATGAVLTASLSAGFLFVHLSAAQASNIFSLLFGNILGISDADVRIIAFTAIPVLALLLLATNPLLFASIDPVVAEARGVPTGWLRLGFLLVLSLVVSVAIQVVGVLLIFSLLVTPAATARRLTARPITAMLLSMVLAIAFTWLGLIAGFYTPFPVSFYITTFAFGAYLLSHAVRIPGGKANAAI